METQGQCPWCGHRFAIVLDPDPAADAIRTECAQCGQPLLVTRAEGGALVQPTGPAPGQSATRRRKRRRRRRSRVVLTRLLKRLRRACGTIETPQEWFDHVKPLMELLYHADSDLPAAVRKPLEEASRLVEASSDALNTSCQVLRLEIQKVMPHLPPAPIWPTVLTGGLITAAVAAGAVMAVIGLQPTATITVRNVGCRAISPPPALLGLVPGISVFPAPLGPGETGMMEVPAVTVAAAMESGDLRVGFWGLWVPFSLADNVTAITVNGHPLGPGETQVNLRAQEEHTLTITCG